MVCIVASACPAPRPRWHKAFMAMLPTIVTHAKYAFRYPNPEARSEAVQEVVANACRAYARLVKLKKTDLAYPNVLARYGVGQACDHRKVGGKLNIHDVRSQHCQDNKGLTVERLDRFDSQKNAWEEILVEDRHAGPAEIASTRIDFNDWLHQLPRRNRRIAEFLSLGNRTDDTARKFNLSNACISRVRRELGESWKKFTGGNEANAA